MEITEGKWEKIKKKRDEKKEEAKEKQKEEGKKNLIGSELLLLQKLRNLPSLVYKYKCISDGRCPYF